MKKIVCLTGIIFVLIGELGASLSADKSSQTLKPDVEEILDAYGDDDMISDADFDKVMKLIHGSVFRIQACRILTVVGYLVELTGMIFF